MGSTVVQLRAGDPLAATLALVAGVALAKTIRALAPAIDFQLKWPNDVLADGAKCSGILLERSGDSVVIGIGVNLVSAPDLPDRATASLAEKGASIDRDRFADALAVAMADALWTWRQEGVESIVRAWLPLGHPVGTPLHVSEQALDGYFDGLAHDGAADAHRVHHFLLGRQPVSRLERAAQEFLTDEPGDLRGQAESHHLFRLILQRTSFSS